MAAASTLLHKQQNMCMYVMSLRALIKPRDSSGTGEWRESTATLRKALIGGPPSPHLFTPPIPFSSALPDNKDATNSHAN